MAPPKGFQDLATVYNMNAGALTNVIGVVTDIMTPVMTKTGDYMLTCKILDDRLKNAVYGSIGLIMRFFDPEISQLPVLHGHGDVVLLRNVKMSRFRQEPVAISHRSTSCLVFPAASIPDPGYSIAFQGTARLNALGAPGEVEKLTLEEQSYVIQLKAELRATVQQIPDAAVADYRRKRDAGAAAPSAPPAKKARHSGFGYKFKVIEELRHFDFADLCVEVVKTYPAHFAACELYVTDYTANEAMWLYTAPEEEAAYQRDGDTFGYHQPSKKAWPGPYGYLVLKVNVKDPHASYVNSSITQGDLVLLQNVKLKIMAEGAKLEGDMWPDNLNPAKVQVSKVTNRDLPEVKALYERKEAYLASRNRIKQGGSKSEKNKKKKERKKEKKERQAAAIEGKARDSDLNPYIRCSHTNVPISSIHDILDQENVRHTNDHPPDGCEPYTLPFINAKYRARVRVVGYEPRNLADFAFLDTSGDWKWYFSLTLEEASSHRPRNKEKQRMQVHVGHDEAQYLLGDIDDPCDLRRNPKLLAKLKEKMCILWGNLDEQGGDADDDGGKNALRNRPFECCIFEYGVELDDEDDMKSDENLGWMKLFRMFGITIS